jgi:hypothetical protein
MKSLSKIATDSPQNECKERITNEHKTKKFFFILKVYRRYSFVMNSKLVDREIYSNPIDRNVYLHEISLEVKDILNNVTNLNNSRTKDQTNGTKNSENKRLLPPCFCYKITREDSHEWL